MVFVDTTGRYAIPLEDLEGRVSYEDEFNDLMPDEVTVKAPTDPADFYGNPTFGPAQTVQCRVVGVPRMVRGPDGREVVSSATIYCSGSSAVTVTVTHEITLPDGSKPKILAVATYPDDDGRHHQEVFV